MLHRFEGELPTYPVPVWLMGIVSGTVVICWLLLAGRARRLRASLEQQLRAEKAQLLESVLAGLGDAGFLLNREGEILFANEGASEFFGSSLSLTGKRLSQVVPDERVLRFVDQAFELTTGSLEQEFVITAHPRGRKEDRFLIINAAPVPTSDEGECLVRVVMRDETRRQETEQIRRDFVANASHELRTPLSIINGYLENLLEGVIDEPELARKSLLTMQKHGERLARLVEDMLTISKFENAAEEGAENLRDQQFDAADCVHGVLDRLAPMFEAKKARHVVEIPAGLMIDGDRFYWDQILFNLVENALKENKDDGRLVITIVMEKLPGELVIRVRDNGIGIPHEHLPFVFKRFYRVAKDHSQQKIKGTGLGLSIVKRAVEAHGGQIRVESVPSLRTEFVINLPDVAPTKATAKSE